MGVMEAKPPTVLVNPSAAWEECLHQGELLYVADGLLSILFPDICSGSVGELEVWQQEEEASWDPSPHLQSTWQVATQASG